MVCFALKVGNFIHNAKPNILLAIHLPGYQDESGVFTGSCKGDSGGPLKTQFVDSKRDTLIGIVSGGVGCGNGIPGWYTKVPNNNVHIFNI